MFSATKELPIESDRRNPIRADPKHLLARPTAVLIATDGTAQSDAAIAFTKLLTLADKHEVQLLTVVDHAPIPWGTVDRSVVMGYQRGLREEAAAKATAQRDRLGDKSWSVEVQSGDPATAIADLAKESQARIVVVGLGSHGPAARFFGNETALRLMRVSQVPVLAVDSKLRALPKRIMVAMDFREASIEGARLALEIAAPKAIVTLVHVVPWERKDYIPEGWFREYEASINSQLTRVTGWLDHSSEYPIHRKILYGRPGPTLLACAEELDADLIVAGTHGSGFVGRMLKGETVAKLVRGARRSLLVLPAAAAFQRFDQPMDEVKPPPLEADLAQRLNDFSRRNLGRRGRLEVDDLALGAQVEMSGYAFLGAAYDPGNRRAQLMFGAPGRQGPHLVRGISNVKSVDILSDADGDSDSALCIASDEGQTLLVLRPVTEVH
jgi:nucleotide-binding universal stress UspA family protein